METLIQEWPGGIYTASGGTRTAVKLSRPWQKDIEVDSSKCPFEPDKLGNREVFARSEAAGGWLVLGNLNTPMPFHRLIIPTHCLPNEKLRVLGGKDYINAAFDLTYQVIGTAAETCDVLEITVYVGALAGQNFSHLHYHLVEPPSLPQEGGSKKKILPYRRIDSSLVVLQNWELVAVAGGHRAGQCFILPCGSDVEVSIANLSNIVARLVALYAEKFCSTEGLAPDYQIGLKFVHGRFDYGIFVPILNHWGVTEYFALLGTGPIILPWPHEETAKHLKGE